MGQTALAPCQCKCPNNHAKEVSSFPSQRAACIGRLCFSAASGDVAQVRALLESDVGIDSLDYDRRSALHVASSEGHSAVVQLLLDMGASVNVRDRWGHSPLDEARRGGFNDIQKALLAAGAVDVECTNSGTPPPPEDSSLGENTGPVASQRFMAVVAAGALDQVQKLVASGSDINAIDRDGRMPLHIAASYGHHDIAEWLVKNGAILDRSDSRGLTPLGEAMRLGQTVAAQKLAALGADASEIAMAEVQLRSKTELWSIKSSDILNKQAFCNTLKSSIFRAEWRGLQVVVKSGKVCNKLTVADKRAMQEELMHEIKILATLRHPDLVMFLGAGFDTTPYFFVTEYMQGGDLERYYKNQANRTGSPFRPSFERLIRWSSSVARALCFLHNCSRPIVHRDLKPMNLLLTHTEDLKVTDFGISKLMLPQAGGAQEAEYAEAKMSGGVGTWRYMAPEIVRFEQYTDRVDIYSFALIVWFMSTGHQPFVREFGRDAEVVLKQYLKGKEPRPNVESVRSGPDVRCLIGDCWQPIPSSRPSAHECTRRLAYACDDDSYGGFMGRAKSLKKLKEEA